MITFEIKDRDGLARIGRLATPHGTVTTPALLPVINPNRPTIPAKELRRLGFEMAITNAYIVRRKPELAAEAKRRGVHDLLGFDGPIMTDSGTFQMYVYGDVEVTNREIVEFQREIGSDVGTILDVFSTPERTFEEARSDLEETARRAIEAREFSGGMGLAIPVQGSVYPELREECARSYRDADAAVHPVGGVVPLMEQQRYAELVRVVLAAKRGLRSGRPVHLFGAGHPMMFPLAALLGCDMFDSAGYGKYARDDRLMFPWGTAHLADLSELACACPVCQSTSPQGLRDLPSGEREERIATHNLFVAGAELRRIREAIRRGRLWELVEERCRVHPLLMEALHALLPHVPWLERFEPISRPSALLLSSVESLSRPAVLRARTRLASRPRFPHALRLAILEARGKPYTANYSVVYEDARRRGILLSCASAFGPVPLELSETYPFSQSVERRGLPGVAAKELAEAFASSHGLQIASPPADLASGPARSLDEARIRAICDYQFGRGAAEALLSDDVTFVRGANGRVRNVRVGGEHVLSLRATDGFFTLKPAGARRLHAGVPRPRFRVVANADAAPFVREGRSLFARFVVEADPELRPYDECLVVDEQDALLGHGLSVFNREEMLDAEHGMVVKIREGFGTR